MGRQRTTFLDELGAFFLAVPWWIGPIIAAVTYGLFRFALSPILASIFSVEINPSAAPMNKTLVQVIAPMPAKIAPWVALLVLVVWVVSLVQRMKRQKLLEQARELENLKALSWQDFELLIGEYYRQRGFMVEERGGSLPDGGVDVLLKKEGKTTLVQCKHWKAAKVGIRQIRELLGVMTHEGASGGVFVTSGQYTADAINFAPKKRHRTY